MALGNVSVGADARFGFEAYYMVRLATLEIRCN